MQEKPLAEKPVLAWDGERWVRAMWVPKHTKEQPGDSDWYEYNEADDTYYWPEGWYELQTHKGATERERTAFLAGFKSATKPEKTMAELTQALTAGMPLAKDLPPGTCEACEGEGEQGGQFCGGPWTCETCGGTGKFPNTEVCGNDRR